MKNIVQHKKGVFALLFLIFFSALFAAEPLVTSDQVTSYVIEDYAFSVKGKSKDFALRSVVVPSGGDPVFMTEEDMDKALAAKKQMLVNKRIFTRVEYDYTLDSYNKGTAKYIATFYIEDSSSFLAIPFPKFDNDTDGFKLGVKMFAPNLFGTFSNLEMTGSVAQGNGGRDGWENRQDALLMNLTSFPIGKTFLDFTFDYERTKGSTDAGKFNFSFNWKNLTIKQAKLNIAPWGYFRPSSDFITWAPQEYGVTWNLGPFSQNDSTYTLSNTLKVHTIETQFYTYTSLNQHELSFFSLPISFKIFVESNKLIGAENLSYMNVGATLGTGFGLPFGMRWSGSVTPALHYKPSDVPVPYSYLISNTISKSNINWKGNFRKGISFSLKYITDIYPQDEYKDLRTEKYVAADISWFPFATSFINPSIQFKGFMADNKQSNYFTYNSTIAEYMRGYLTGTIEDKALSTIREYGAVINMNLTTKFINFGFAKSYASPFLDIGIFHNEDNPEKPIIISSAGLDGWGILNKFPQYPVRGSLGFNLDSVRRAIDKEISFTEIEWELYIGMGLFF